MKTKHFAASRLRSAPPPQSHRYNAGGGGHVPDKAADTRPRTESDQHAENSVANSVYGGAADGTFVLHFQIGGTRAPD